MFSYLLCQYIIIYLVYTVWLRLYVNLCKLVRELVDLVVTEYDVSIFRLLAKIYETFHSQK